MDTDSKQDIMIGILTGIMLVAGFRLGLDLTNHTMISIVIALIFGLGTRFVSQFLLRRLSSQ
ncbi:hypothetical protein [Halobacillus seohaensis]|uniref:Uncharacterized protein n=1 Tax=Halobacillus seohaensis TaxID=447421 RepID=A0ABW2EN84_9BACI